MSDSLKIDLGCGPNKRDGFVGADRLPFDGRVDVVCDLAVERWPWDDDSVDEAHSSHFLEHLTSPQRVHFANELWRVLKVGAKALVVTPHWCAARAYGDPTHQWPPVSEWWPLYLHEEWRMANAPHADARNDPTMLSCDFDFVSGHSWHPALNDRSDVVRAEWTSWRKEAIQDSYFTLTKRPRK